MQNVKESKDCRINHMNLSSISNADSRRYNYPASGSNIIIHWDIDIKNNHQEKMFFISYLKYIGAGHSLLFLLAEVQNESYF